MSKPVYGDPAIDQEAHIILGQVCRITPKMCKNLDLKTAKKMRKALSAVSVMLDDCIITKIEQSIGGIKGNARKNL